MNVEELKKKIDKCKNINIDDISINDIDDINKFKIDKRKSSNERILDFLIETKNPYVFMIEGRIVQISFSDTDKSADDCLTSVLNKLYK